MDRADTKRPVIRAALTTLAVLSIAGCATTRPSVDEGTPLALILATDAYELHLDDGKLYKVAPIGADLERTEVATWAEFADLYDVKKAKVLETTPPGRQVEVSGWQGLDCLREGHVCGVQPEPYGRGDAVRLRLEFRK